MGSSRSEGVNGRTSRGLLVILGSLTLVGSGLFPMNIAACKAGSTPGLDTPRPPYVLTGLRNQVTLAVQQVHYWIATYWHSDRFPLSLNTTMRRMLLKIRWFSMPVLKNVCWLAVEAFVFSFPAGSCQRVAKT